MIIDINVEKVLSGTEAALNFAACQLRGSSDPTCVTVTTCDATLAGNLLQDYDATNIAFATGDPELIFTILDGDGNTISCTISHN